MQDVYANGLLNLSATDPDSPLDGLLKSRSTDERPVYISILDTSAKPSHFRIQCGTFWDNFVHKMPVNRRA